MVLIAGYGLGLASDGVFDTDLSMGFPPSTVLGHGSVSWHGMHHLLCAGVGSICFIVACFVVATRFSPADERGWAGYLRSTGAMFAAGFAAVASWSDSPVVVLLFSATLLIAWALLTMISMKFYRSV